MLGSLSRRTIPAEEARAMKTAPELQLQKEQICERLSQLDAERQKLAEEVRELEAAERVLTRFAKPEAAERRRRGQAASAQPRRGRAAQQLLERLVDVAADEGAQPRRLRVVQQPAVPLSEAVLRAVRAHPGGISASAVLIHMQREFGLTVRPNQLGIALQRHRRAGLLGTEPGAEPGESLCYPLGSAASEAPAHGIPGDRGDASQLLEDAAAKFRRASDQLLAVADQTLAEIREGKEQTRALLDRLEARLASHG
jgi:hypothetical protein